MKTDDLIAMLSANVEQVSRRRLVRALGTAITISAALVVAVVLIFLGARPDLMKAGAIAYLLLKLGFTMLLLVPASIFLIMLARPGGERKTSVIVLALPFLAIMILAAISLAFTPSSHWG